MSPNKLSIEGPRRRNKQFSKADLDAQVTFAKHFYKAINIARREIGLDEYEAGSTDMLAATYCVGDLFRHPHLFWKKTTSSNSTKPVMRFLSSRIQEAAQKTLKERSDKSSLTPQMRDFLKAVAKKPQEESYLLEKIHALSIRKIVTRGLERPHWSATFVKNAALSL